MSVTFVRPLKRGRHGSRELENGKRTYTQTFIVGTDDPQDGSLIARTAIDPNGGPVIPQPWSFYVAGNEEDLGAFVKSVEASEIGETGMLWEVTVTADSEGPDPIKPEEDPTQRPSELSWSFAQFQEVAEKDVVTDKPIVNSAGTPFDPPIQIDQSRPVLNIERNEATFDPAVAISYMDAVNSDAFLGFAPGQAKISNISARRQFENMQFYWKVSYEIHFNLEGWKKQVLDQGFYKLGAGNKVTPILDDQGDPVTSPQLLDGNGGVLPVPLTQPAAYLTFDVYDELPFSALALP